MKTDAERAAHAAYMRDYNRKNREKIAQRRLERSALPEIKAKKLAQDARYRSKKRESGEFYTEEHRKYFAEKSAIYRSKHPDKVREAKRKYYSTEKGKASKRKEDAAYVASGKRAIAEQRRSYKPISDARKQARKRWAAQNRDYYAANRAKRRSLQKHLDADDFFILQEAMRLAKLREKMLGGKWHVDHIVPVSLGGTSCPDNIQVVPAIWNMRKSNKHSDKFFGRA